MAAPEVQYVYRATVTRWVDGDTLDVHIDLGFHIAANVRMRVYALDTPEVGQPLHDEAAARSEALAPAGSLVTLQTYKSDKYGRFLADVICDDGRSVSEVLISEGLAYAYFGGNKVAEKAAAEDASVAQQQEHLEQ